MFELKNQMETVVYESLQNYLQHSELRCDCERCRADIMALVLNRLPPRYAVSLRGEILTALESQSSTSQALVLVEIISAISKIGESPSHPIKESYRIFGNEKRIIETTCQGDESPIKE